MDTPFADVPFDAANFAPTNDGTASQGYWNVTADDVRWYRWARVGDVGFIQLAVDQGSDVGGTFAGPEALFVKLPDEIACAARSEGSYAYTQDPNDTDWKIDGRWIVFESYDPIAAPASRWMKFTTYPGTAFTNANPSNLAFTANLTIPLKPLDPPE